MFSMCNDIYTADYVHAVHMSFTNVHVDDSGDGKISEKKGCFKKWNSLLEKNFT